MKVLSEPSSGRIGNRVAFISRYGQYQREYLVPRNTRSPARDHMRASFGRLSRAWSELLTEAQRDAWCVAGPKVQSAKRLGTSGPLTGQQHFQGINAARSRIGLDMLLMPPAPVVLGPNPVGQLVITNDENGVRLLLNISRPPAEDIMVFGQAPCNSGRRKRRNVSYLGLLPAAHAGLSDITDIYIGRFGESRVGQRAFIVTRQQKDGWEGADNVTSEIVPLKPLENQAATAAALPLLVHGHKGYTRDAQGKIELPAGGSLVNGKLEDQAMEDAVAGSGEAGADGVAQVSKPAVSPTSKSADLLLALRSWKPATQQAWKPALRQATRGRRRRAGEVSPQAREVLAGEENLGDTLDLPQRAAERPNLRLAISGASHVRSPPELYHWSEP